MTTPLPQRKLDVGPYYLPNLIAAIAASVGIIVGSAAPWASVLVVLTLSGGWFHGTPTLVIGAISAVALFTLLNRGRAGFGPRGLVPLAWVAPIAGLVCLVIAVIDIHDVVSASQHWFGVHVEWGLWLVAVSSVALCVTGSVVALQVGAVSEGSEAWTRTAITIAALVVLGGVIYFTARPQVVQTQGPQPPGTETVTNTETVTSNSPVPVTVPTPAQRPIPIAGADGQGFLGYPAARCDGVDNAAMIERTTMSVLVVCRSGSGGYYYKGVRLSDTAPIELGGATPVAAGFDVVNPSDGTRYQVRTSGLTIISGGEVFTEPVVQYAMG